MTVFCPWAWKAPELNLVGSGLSWGGGRDNIRGQC